MPSGVQAPVIDGGSSPTELPLDRLIALRADAVRLASTLGGVTTLPGHARTLLRGRGFDFDEMRPYVEGDDVRHIDWNVT